jgi:hypothetical protein
MRAFVLITICLLVFGGVQALGAGVGVASAAAWGVLALGCLIQKEAS